MLQPCMSIVFYLCKFRVLSMSLLYSLTISARAIVPLILGRV